MYLSSPNKISRVKGWQFSKEASFSMWKLIAFLLFFSLTCSAAELPVNNITHYDINKTINHIQDSWGEWSISNNSLSKNHYTLLNDKFYFVIDNHGLGKELWVHDPITNNETLINDINVGVDSSSPENLTVLNDKLYFSAYTKENGRELWVYDDDSKKSSLIKDLAIGLEGSGDAKSSNPVEFIAYNNKLFFFIDGVNETINELWSYQPSNKVFEKILESDIEGFYSNTLFNNKLYLFYKTTTANDQEPNLGIIYDDNTGVSEEVVPTQFEQILSHPHIQIDSKVYAGLNSQLVAVDVSTKNITPLLNNKNSLNFHHNYNDGSFTFHDGSIYIELSDYSDDKPDDYDVYPGFELYRYNIIEDSLALAVEIDSTTDDGNYPKSSDFKSVFSYNNKLYFSARAKLIGRKLWSYSSATEKITQESQYTDVNTMNSSPSSLTIHDGSVYFITEEIETAFEASFEVWRLNLADNTVVLFKELNSEYSVHYPHVLPKLFTFKGKLGYSIRTDTYSDQLWLVDDKTNIHEMIFETNSAMEGWEIVAFPSNNLLYFQIKSNLKIYDSTNKSIQAVDESILGAFGILDNRFYYYKYNDDRQIEIWFHDSINKTTAKLQPDNFNENIHQELVIRFAANNKLYLNKEGVNNFFIYDPETNQFEDTIIEAPANGEDNYILQLNYQYNSTVYLDYTANYGRELYEIDLITNEMKLTANLNLPLNGDDSNDSFGSYPYGMFEFKEQLYFSAKKLNASRLSPGINSSWYANENTFWQYSPNEENLTQIKLGSETDSYTFGETVYHQGKIISSGTVIRDGINYGKELFVVDVNHAPSLSINAPANAESGNTVRLDASNSYDDDNDELTYHWQQMSGTSVSLIDKNSAIASFIAPKVLNDEELIFELITSDGVEVVNRSVSITVLYTNSSAPTISIKSHQDKSGGIMMWLIFLMISTVIYRTPS